MEDCCRPQIHSCHSTICVHTLNWQIQLQRNKYKTQNSIKSSSTNVQYTVTDLNKCLQPLQRVKCKLPTCVFSLLQNSASVFSVGPWWNEMLSAIRMKEFHFLQVNMSEMEQNISRKSNTFQCALKEQINNWKTVRVVCPYPILYWTL